MAQGLNRTAGVRRSFRKAPEVFYYYNQNCIGYLFYVLPLFFFFFITDHYLHSGMIVILLILVIN